MGLKDVLVRWLAPEEERDLGLSWQQYQSYFSYGGNQYGLLGLNQTLVGNEEKIGAGFAGLADGTMRGNAVVFACMALRMRVFSEARLLFRQVRSGRPGDLFGTPALRLLERPWPNGTTGDLLAKSELHATLAGNAFICRRRDRLVCLRPDWVTIVSGVPRQPDSNGWDLDAELIGYGYQPGGPAQGKDIIALSPNEVAHFAPYPDPTSPWRGMSWLTPVIREVMADSAATTHKLKFFENGATPNMVVKLDVNNLESFQAWIAAFEAKHKGVSNAYETLYLGAGADATVVGADMRQLDFKITQGGGETRIAAAAGTPPVLVGLSEGLQAATYSNYGQARRAFADETMRPTWRNFAGSISSIIDVPTDAELWYDDRDVPFLAEDVKDAAEIQGREATTIDTLIKSGFTPESVVGAITAGDLKRLKHSGLVSVQLQPPGGGAEGGLSVMDMAFALQRIYLAVGKVISPEEAREILNRAGAGLGALPEGLDGGGSNGHVPAELTPTA